jgi:hypothetical protein
MVENDKASDPEATEPQRAALRRWPDYLLFAIVAALSLAIGVVSITNGTSSLQVVSGLVIAACGIALGLFLLTGEASRLRDVFGWLFRAALVLSIVGGAIALLVWGIGLMSVPVALIVGAVIIALAIVVAALRE